MTMAGIPPHGDEFSVETRINSPAHFLIKIESFSLLSKHRLQRYESREFTAGDHKWRLIFYPDGHPSAKHLGENKVNCISVYLAIVESSSLSVNWEVNAAFNILLHNKKLDNYRCFRGKVRRFHSEKSTWGISKMIYKKYFTDPSNGFLVNDNCSFGAEVFVLKGQRAYERLSVLDGTNQGKYNFRISNFAQLKETWYSEEFSVGGLRWRIMLYPDGVASVRGKSISIFLECVNLALPKKVKVDYWIRIKDQFDDGGSLSRSVSKWFDGTTKPWGWIAFASIADIRDPKKGYVADGSCVVEAKIYLQAISTYTP